MNKKDLSYQAQATKRRQLLLDNIKSINDTLKYEKVGVNLYVSSESLLLNYRFDGKRVRISPTGVNLSTGGLELARSLALKIGNAIQGGYYDDDFLQRDIYRVRKKIEVVEVTQSLMWDDVVRDFPSKWLKYRSGDKTATDRQKADSLKHYTVQLRLMSTHLDKGRVFDAKQIQRLLDSQEEGSDKRFRLRETLSVVARMYGVAFNFVGIGKRPKPMKRDIPTDDEIITAWEGFVDIKGCEGSKRDTVLGYRWLFSVLSTYGLRPQELFAIDMSKSFQPAKNYWVCLDESLTDGLKTGDRWVAPIHPEWVEKFRIVNAEVTYPPTVSDRLERRVAAVSQYLRKHFSHIKAYSLRHAYAIRCRKLGLGQLDAADLMGHDPSTHHKQYHRWIDTDDRIESVANALDRNKSGESL